MSFLRPRASSLGRFLGLALIAAWVAAPARADNLDEELNKKAPRLVEILQDLEVQGVGVLPFRVKEGSREETFEAGPLNKNLSLRVENALIIHLGPADRPPFRVIHDAARVVSAAGLGGWFRNPAQRPKLFAVKDYPQAWGQAKVKAEAFLTGKVVLSEELEKAEVVIELLEAAHPQNLEEVLRFSFVPDMPLLHDLAITYDHRGKGQVTFRQLPRYRAEARPKNEQPAVQLPPVTHSMVVGDVEVKLLCNGKPALIRGDQIESPAKDDRVSFTLTNKSSTEQRGVDVKLNGISLVLEDTHPPEYARVFILDPQKTISVKGFLVQVEGEEARFAPFTILSGDKTGQIQVTVFQKDESPANELVISRSLRGLQPSQEKEARSSLARLRARLMAEAALKVRVEEKRQGNQVVKREIIVKDTKAENEIREGIRSVKFRRAPLPVGTTILTLVPKGALK